MSDDQVFYVRPDDIVHDTIEGETVVIDLRNGVYFRFDGAATHAWAVLLGRATEAELIDRLEAAYTGSRAAIAEQVHGFLIALYRDGIIRREEASGPASAGEAAGSEHGASDAPRDAFVGLSVDRFDHLRAMAGAPPKQPFDGMTVNRFDDLDELLAIDPVHEVEDAGWPHRQDAG